MRGKTMKKLILNDPETRSADVVAENIEQLKALFPEAFTEGKIDFEVLKQLLGGAVEDREEKYGLNWHGKRRARQLALIPSTGTLRPCPEESVDWDTTQNIMIEGDNLEVLKLLQKSYAGKVKVVCIDPPYNTGKDFVYPDNFQDNIRNYLELTCQVEDGRKITSNTEASGRFHTDWLNMMYPRLKLARTLLRFDGAIYLSIDDCELNHLKSILDEIFGPENFIALFVWEKRTTRENRRVFSFNHEYVLCVAKNKSDFEQSRNLLPITEELRDRYSNPDNDPRGPWQSVSLNAQAGHATPDQFYAFKGPGGKVFEPPPGRCWAVTKGKLEELIADNRVWFGSSRNNVPRRKLFLAEAKNGLTPHTLWTAMEVGTNDTAKKELIELFQGVAVFETPKPPALIRRIIEITTEQSDLVLDFFAGSGTTGHAVMAQNAADGGNRRYILVQLPEPLDPDNKDQKVAANFCDKLGKPRNIAELTKERLRRAAKKIKDENPMFAGDLGFRVFKLDSTNIREWEPDRDNLDQTLLDHMEHIKERRTQEDILYEMLLKLGLDLCVPMEKRIIVGKDVYSIGAGVLIACLAEAISREEVEPLAQGIVEWHKSLAPAGDTTCVFRDSAFQDDVAKTNLAAILEQHGIANVRSL
jgi:adenine-specific DNA-methyltransferase